MSKHVDKITQTIQDPDVLVLGFRGELKAPKFYHGLPIGPKFLVAVYRKVQDEKVIITTYLNSNMTKVKGKTLRKRLA